jgi:glycosyltransferase involved in cell wall biosynthesis
MISTDRGLFDLQSGVSKRFKNYSKIFEELHVIVFTKKGHEKVQISDNVFIYPTNSFSKLNYVHDAVVIGRNLKGDVVSAQDTFLTGISAFRLSGILKSKFHLQIHTDIFSENFKKHSILNQSHVFIAKLLLKKADGVRVVSKRIAESLKKLNLKIETFVLPIAVDLESFNKEEQKLDKKFVYNILTVARFESEKNVGLAIEVFAKIVSQRSDVGLTIVGGGSLENELKNLATNFGVSEKINFVGKISNVSDYYKNADVYIQTSKYEGYGMSLVEAAYVGLPIVTTDVGIVGEVLVDGGSCLVAKDNPEDFSTKIIQLLDDDILRQSLGGRARESAVNHLQSEEQYLDNFKKAFSI